MHSEDTIKYQISNDAHTYLHTFTAERAVAGCCLFVIWNTVSGILMLSVYGVAVQFASDNNTYNDEIWKAQ